MRLGFVGGAIFATWLTLTYPDEMATIFEKITNVFQQVITPATATKTESDV